MPARLRSLTDQLDIDLAKILTVIGRHRDCDFRVDSSRVSRRHCCIALSSDEVVVRDLSSRNGTWINGRPITAATELRHGDELGIAHLRYRLEITGEGLDGDVGLSR
jgi:pSer/pThr/pTyr-binding forkhead associated (FHA) protein